jgi:dTMP kinase
MTACSLFISFEGIDGAGKSTHLTRLAQDLSHQGHSICLTREPGGTQVGEQMRQLLLNHALDPVTEALLLFAARREHACQRIQPALKQGQIVLCDRFTDASFAYQGGGRGVDEFLLTQLAACIPVEPTLTLWFDLPVAVAMERRQGRAEQIEQVQPDRFEQETSAFFERVRQAYAKRAHAHSPRIVRIDASLGPEEVYQKAYQAVRTHVLNQVRPQP